MSGREIDSYDVIIAGAGPVGLLLACELRLGGCAVLVLEREAGAGSALKQLPFGLRGLNEASLEGLDRRGLLAEIEAGAVERRASGEAKAAHWLGQARRAGGHFAGIPFFHDQVDGAHWPHRLAGAPGSLACELAHIEAVLAARAVALGVEIRRGCAVEGVTQAADGVVVRAGGQSLRGRWLAGCDGGRSVVRKAAGIGFTGTDAEFTGYSVLVELDGPGKLLAGRHHTGQGMYTFTAPGTIAMVEFDGGAMHRGAPVTRAHVQAVLRRVAGVDVRVAALHQATTWTDRACQAATYRAGRVVLAGDAAHIHSPLGGQGLNLGLGDAMNLGWKLAAILRGDGPEGLIDSYEEERRPVGAQVLDWSRAQVALMRPDRGSRALAEVMRALIGTGDGASYVAGRVWGLGTRYDFGDGHALVGRSAPDVALADGTRLNALLRTGRGMLAGGDGPGFEAMRAGWAGRICCAGGVAQDGPAAMLVRPDGVVAWASDDGADATGAMRAASRWFGAARSRKIRPCS